MENERQLQLGILGKARDKSQGEKLCVDEDLTELVVVVSNSDLSQELPPEPAPRIIADAVGCEFVEGWAKAKLRIKNENTDISYVSSRAKLRFKPRASPLQDMPGNTQYDLMPTAVTWTASGKEGDCTISGQIVVNIPSFENQPLSVLATEPAYGNLNVVGLDGGISTASKSRQ